MDEQNSTQQLACTGAINVAKCTSPDDGSAAASNAARLLLLGAAQDAGVPQCGCHCTNCSTVRRGDMARQYAVSAALLDDSDKTAWLLDCTPDFKEQYDLLQRQAPGYQLAGVLLTHLHSGHYMGLVQFGREMMDWKGLQVVGSHHICSFLQSNEPWATYIRNGNFILSALASTSLQDLTAGTCQNAHHPLPYEHILQYEQHGTQHRQHHCSQATVSPSSQCPAPSSMAHAAIPTSSASDVPAEPQQATGTANSTSSSAKGIPTYSISSSLSVQAVAVPHRAEFSDCVAYRVLSSSGRSAFYCPDIDSWHEWEATTGVEPVAWAANSNTFAFLDACFNSAEELPGRDMSQIPHPLVQDTLQRLEAAKPWRAEAVVLQHMNHSNPIYRDTPARRTCLKAGVLVGEQGMVFEL